MDTILKTVGNLLPYHLLCYGALLGTEVFQVSAAILPRQRKERLIFLASKVHITLMLTF